jgi:NAD(P)-dependent dehydrogenase (short-subunit alcohol dehydrogenase family)
MRNLARRGPLEAALETAGVSVRVEISALDVTDTVSLQTAVARTLTATGGRLDAVVHNAGIAAGGAFEDIPDADLRRVMETNFWGVLALTRALLPTFRKQRGGQSRVGRNRSPLKCAPWESTLCSSSRDPT